MKQIRSGKHGQVKRISPKTGLFRSELIFAQIDETDKTRLLKRLCKKLGVLGYVTDGFLDSVLERRKKHFNRYRERVRHSARTQRICKSFGGSVRIA